MPDPITITPGTATAMQPISVMLNLTVSDFANLQIFLDTVVGSIAGAKIVSVQVGQVTY